MSAVNLSNADKEILKKRLELLQKEYERTSQKLQRAERRDVVRKHVQDTISRQNRTRVSESAGPEPSASCPPDLLSMYCSASGTADDEKEQNVPVEASRAPICTGKGKKIMSNVRYDLPKGTSAPPFTPLTCKRSSSQRLRSRSSRLRLQMRERESDTAESQEKTRSQTVDHESPGEDDRKPSEEGTRKDMGVNASETGQSAADACAAPQSPGFESGSANIFNSCTIIEGLPFPVEYYVRTTRRMALTCSPVDINAIILSQLSRGRSRRKAGKAQANTRKQSRLQSPTVSLPLSVKPSSSTGPDFKHLSDSQLYLDCHPLTDSEVYPIFRKRQGTTDQTRPLPSLTSLAQALRDRDFRNLGHLLTVLDVKDFHLPDDEFGQLKLERLRALSPSVETLICGGLRRPGSTGGSDAGHIESERFVPCRTSLDSSLPLSREPIRDESSETCKEVKTSQSCLTLNLSVSMTTHTQVDPDPSFISLGATPACLAPPSSFDQNEVSARPETETQGHGVSASVCANEELTALVEVESDGCDRVQTESDGPETRMPNSAEETPKLSKHGCESENGENGSSKSKELPERAELPPPDATIDETGVPDPHTPSLHSASISRSSSEADCISTKSMMSADVLSCGSLQKTHTIKALDGGRVLNVCSVRWPAGAWCVCVAGESSVCVWTQEAVVQRWVLTHSWTFSQSIISLQDVPDSSGLLCVALGKDKIMEARILCCSGLFSQSELCTEALQALLPLSDLRVTSCSAPGPQQMVRVFTLAHDGRVTRTLPLVSTNQSVQSLVAVEMERHALIGWTDQKHLVIWNVNSGQLLQTIDLAGGVALGTCLRGYSYRGTLCLLLQCGRAGSEDEHSTTVFTLIAANPLTGKCVTLTSLTDPTDLTDRLIEGDVCEMSLVGVFQSGRLAIWDLRGGGACVHVNEPAEGLCLARWAGPSTLLTGYQNGDVDVYEYKPAVNEGIS